MFKSVLISILFSITANANFFTSTQADPRYPCSNKSHLDRQFFEYFADDLEVTTDDKLSFKVYAKSYTCKGSFWRGYSWKNLGFKANQSFAWKYNNASGEAQFEKEAYHLNTDAEYGDVIFYDKSFSIPLQDLATERSELSDIQIRFHMNSEYEWQDDVLSNSYYKLSLLLNYSAEAGYITSEESFVLHNPVIPTKQLTQKSIDNDYDAAFCFDNGTSAKIYIDNTPVTERLPYLKTNIRFFRNKNLLGGFNSKKVLTHTESEDRLLFVEERFTDGEASLQIWIDTTARAKSGWLPARGQLINWELPGTDGQNLTCRVRIKL